MMSNNNVSGLKNPDLDQYWNGVVDIESSTWLFDLDQFERETASRKVNMSFQDELNKRVKGVVFIFNCCKNLRLSRSVGLTAATCFHRFYMLDDLVKFHYFEIGATSLFIACKSEECRRNLKDFVKVCARVASGKPDPVDEDSKIFWRWKDNIVKLEELMLQELNFDVIPPNPYKITLDVLKINTESGNSESPNEDWDKQAKNLFGNHCTYLFELLSRLPICLFYPPEHICAVVVLLGSKKPKITFPVNFIKDSFHLSITDLLKCYDDIISLATDVDLLDKWFRVLPYIPRTTHSELEELYNGTDESTLRF